MLQVASTVAVNISFNDRPIVLSQSDPEGEENRGPQQQDPIFFLSIPKTYWLADGLPQLVVIIHLGSYANR